VLAVDRQQRRAAARDRAHEERAADDERFLVGEQQPLAGRGGGEARCEAGGADDRRHHGVGVGMRSELAQRPGAARHRGVDSGVAQPCRERAPFVGGRDRGVARPEANAEREQLVEPAVRGEREDLEAIGMRGDDVERREADPSRSRRARRRVAADRRSRASSSQHHQRERDRKHGQQAVDAVEDAAVARAAALLLSFARRCA
jgi:hypothetical protein